jgi:putative lipoprotein
MTREGQIIAFFWGLVVIAKSAWRLEMPLPNRESGPVRSTGCLMAAVVTGAWLAAGILLAAISPARAQTLQAPVQDSDPADTEDVTEGATIVRGKYTAGETSVDWEAAVRQGKPERIAEWRDYGDNGSANVVFSFHNGDLMHYAEHGRRRGGQAGSMDGLRRVELNLSFSNGRFTGGKKTVDGIETEPTEAEIRGANVQALSALERLAASKSVWQEIRPGTSFSVATIPQAAGPSAEARQLAGAGGEIVFRCSETLVAVLGSAQDRLVVETQGRSPVTLQRQPPGQRYDYFGAGWGAQRSGEEIRLEEASGRAMICRIVSAAAPPSSLPPPASPAMR